MLKVFIHNKNSN